MSLDNFVGILADLLSKKPFHAFTIELHGGFQHEIDHAGAILFRGGAAMIIAPGGMHVYIDHDSVNQIFDAPRELCPSV